MMIEPILFYLLSGLALLGAFKMVMSADPIKAALFLMLIFFAMSGIWLLLEAEFLALALLFMYVGAVLVLFLFVIMMLDKDDFLKEGGRGFFCLGLMVSALMSGSLIYVLKHCFKGSILTETPILPASQIEALGNILYSRFLYPFEIAGVILFVTIVAAISVCFKKGAKRAFLPSERQIEATKKDRLQLIKMTAEKNEP